MKKSILVVLIALASSITISMAQPARQGKGGAQPRMATEQQTEVMVARRVATLKVQLSLDEKQEKQITQILSTFYNWRPSRDIIPQDTTKEQRTKARTESAERRTQMHSDIKGTLTDDQKKKYDQIQAEQQSRVRNGAGRRTSTSFDSNR